ncbi:MAG: SPFH domain-containing protein [Bacilli bacterium]|nr:SPFH domain-containing protein [Bacilli bacterium]
MQDTIELFPSIANNSIVVQFTENIKLNKNVFITVPNEFYAVAFINEKPSARIDVCVKENLLRYIGKEYNYSSIKIAFVRKTDLPYILWGFGGINVKNAKLDEAYMIGANGKYLLKLEDVSKLIKTFGSESNISTEDIKEKTKAIIDTIGAPILSKYFANTEVSVFEINALVDDLREKMISSLRKESIFKNCGLELAEITISKIHVDEDDLELIKNRINHKSELNSFSSLESIKQDILNSIKSTDTESIQKQISDLKEEVSAIYEHQDNEALIDEIDNLRASIQEAVDSVNANKNNLHINEINKQIEELRMEIKNSKYQSVAEYTKQAKALIDQIETKLSNKLDESISNIKEILENSVDEHSQNDVPLYDNAKDEWLAGLKITSDLLLNKATTDDDYAAVAGLIFSNVESNLIEKFKINHHGKDFYMTEVEYYDMASSIKIHGKSIFKDEIKPRYLCFPDLKGSYVEMPLEFRFIKAGLTPEQACHVARDWTVLNKFRHRSEENKSKLAAIMDDRGMGKNELLKSILDSYRELKIYTRD